MTLPLHRIYFGALIIIFLLLHSCKQGGVVESDGRVNVEDIQKFPKIDFHTHFRYERDYLISMLDKWNMQVVLVDVSKTDSAGNVQRSWEPLLEHYRQYPAKFFLCTSFEGTQIGKIHFVPETIVRIQREIDMGAVMVKVWKNFGMVTRDGAGRFVQIDDIRMQGIWDYLTAKNMPVLAHIGEPTQAWMPLDDPHNPHHDYYSTHPEYHAYRHPGIPSWQTIIDARDRWLERNRGLTVIGAHMGSMSQDVDLVAERLDKFPNFYVETAARFGDLAHQESSKVRDFFIKYQDRILFGTDYGNSIPQDSLDQSELLEEADHLEENYQLLWKYLCTTDSLTIRGQKTQGLGLPESVLHKVYYGNAIRILQQIRSL